jgi:hypothetical protein
VEIGGEGEIGGEPGAADRVGGLAGAEEVGDECSVGVGGDEALIDEGAREIEGALGGLADEAEAVARAEQGAAEGAEQGGVGVGALRLVDEGEGAGWEAVPKDSDTLEGGGGRVDEVEVDVEGDALLAEREGPGGAAERDGLDGVGEEGGRALEGVGDGGDDAALLVVAQTLVGVDVEVGAFAEGDRGAELGAEGVVGEGEQLDAGAAGAAVRVEDRGERLLLDAAVGVPEVDHRVIGADAGGEEEREGEREQGEGGAAELLA